MWNWIFLITSLEYSRSVSIASKRMKLMMVESSDIISYSDMIGCGGGEELCLGDF